MNMLYHIIEDSYTFFCKYGTYHSHNNSSIISFFLPSRALFSREYDLGNKAVAANNVHYHLPCYVLSERAHQKYFTISVTLRAARL